MRGPRQRDLERRPSFFWFLWRGIVAGIGAAGREHAGPRRFIHLRTNVLSSSPWVVEAALFDAFQRSGGTDGRWVRG